MKRSLLGTVNLGFYAAVLSLCFLYTAVFFWDLLLVQHLSLLWYLWVVGPFLLYLLFLLGASIYLICILRFPHLSADTASKWPIFLFNMLPMLLYVSGAITEPVREIDLTDANPGNELRYPAFMGLTWRVHTLLLFVNMLSVSVRDEAGSSLGRLFKPFQPMCQMDLNKWKENRRGILSSTLGVFIPLQCTLLIVIDSWIERIAGVVALAVLALSLGSGETFHRYKRTGLVMVLGYAGMRMYYGYHDWRHDGDYLMLGWTIAHCAMIATAVASWHSNGAFGQLFNPYISMKDVDEGNGAKESETTVAAGEKDGLGLGLVDDGKDKYE